MANEGSGAQHEETEFRLKVSDVHVKDAGRALARIDPADIKALGAEIGDIVKITGKRSTVCKIMPAYKEERAASRIQIDSLSRGNAGVSRDEMVTVQKVMAQPAQRIDLSPISAVPTESDLRYVESLVDGIPVLAGDRIRARLFGNRNIDFIVKDTVPKGPVIIAASTILTIRAAANGQAGDKVAARPSLAYEDIGGLKRELRRIREIIELPLRYPEIFERLGIDAPKGVLLYGPPGCGKTLIARAVAHETDAGFYSVNGPEIIHKFYGESEAHLRKIFEEATKRGPSIIFIDEIDAIAPRRESAVGEVEKRVVAQLLGLMDGLKGRENVIVLAATNLPNSIDPALRRPGRFDREIGISIPDRPGRQEILEIHSRGMPLSKEVDLAKLAAITHGFVGADLEALCREAAMSCLRRFFPEIDFAQAELSYELLSRMEVCEDDFLTALREVEPSALREVFVEVPTTTWDDVGGLQDVKQTLREAVEWPLNYPDLLETAGAKPPKGILLSGPPGCGKTLLAQAVASATQVNFISVKGPALLSKYVGESERAVREVFHKAKQAAPCIIFFDEIDALLPRRSEGSSDSHVSERVVGQFLSELDGLEKLKGVLVLAATNRPDIIDPAILRAGRFDARLEIPLPNESARLEILKVHTKGKPLSKDIDFAQIVVHTAGLNGADLESICRRAAMTAVREMVGRMAGPEPGDKAQLIIQQRHFEDAMREILR